MSTDDQAKPATTWPLVPPPLEVPSDDPFAHDRLRRRGEIEQLMVLVEHASTPLVLGLDAAWGTGKTTFVRMWRQTLENAGYRTIYFDAWETDFIAEPLVALVGEVASLLPRTTQAARTAQQKLKSATGLILRKTTPIVARVLTAGLLDIKADDLRSLSLTAEDLEKAIGETAEKVVEAAIDQYKRHRSEVEEFRHALRQAVDVAAGGKPLVFFVDELDRCRPTFAVELLERIKHLFEVPGVLFVLSVHRDQLAHSLKAIYGHDFDGEGYLSRFFHLRYPLAEPAIEDYGRYLADYIGFGGARAVTEPLTFLMTHLRLPIRQQQRCFAQASLVLRIIGRRGHRADDPTLYAVLLALREWKPALYSKFIRSDKSADDVIDALEATDADRWGTRGDTQPIEAALLILEIDRREAMRGEDERLPSWRSRRLELYEQETPEPDRPGVPPGPRPRGARISEEVKRLQRHDSRYFRRGQWQRTLAILELGIKFELLEQRPL